MVLKFDGKARKWDKVRERERGVGGEGAFGEGKEEELESGKPAKEEGRGASEVDGGEPQREEEEEDYGWQEGHEPRCAFRDQLPNCVAVAQCCRG